MSVPSDLIAAYEAAEYEIDVGEMTIRFHIGEHCSKLADILRARQATSATLITAYNPRSRKQSAAENTDAHRSLLHAAARLGKQFVPSRGKDPAGKWPAEPGLFIFDLSAEEGLALARRFDQFAVVRVALRHAPVLVPVQ